jgi:hypothetical protein
MVLKMSNDKTLIMTVSGTTYKDEHNAETIKIIIPKQIDNNDLKHCSVWLCFINEEKLGKAIDVSEFLTDYSSSHYYIEFPMDNIFTYVAGEVKIWLKLLDGQTEMVDKTNYVIKHICKHPDEELEGEITEQERSVLESLTLKLNATSIQLGEVTAKVEDIISGEEQIIQPMLISPIYDET